jgi:hypothetical protein
MENFDDFNSKFNRKRFSPIRKRRRRRRKPISRRDKITMYDYLASSVPADVSFTINRFGRFKKARNEKELAKQLKSFVNMFGDKAIIELSKIHPDRKLLEAGCSKCEETKRNPAPKPHHPFANATGYVAPTTTSDDSGEKEKQTKKITTNMLIIGGFMIMSFALIMKK